MKAVCLLGFGLSVHIVSLCKDLHKNFRVCVNYDVVFRLAYVLCAKMFLIFTALQLVRFARTAFVSCET